MEQRIGAVEGRFRRIRTIAMWVKTNLEWWEVRSVWDMECQRRIFAVILV